MFDIGIGVMVSTKKQQDIIDNILQNSQGLHIHTTTLGNENNILWNVFPNIIIFTIK